MEGEEGSEEDVEELNECVIQVLSDDLTLEREDEAVYSKEYQLTEPNAEELDPRPNVDMMKPSGRELPPIDEVVVQSLATGGALSVRGGSTGAGETWLW